MPQFDRKKALKSLEEEATRNTSMDDMLKAARSKAASISDTFQDEDNIETKEPGIAMPYPAGEAARRQAAKALLNKFVPNSVDTSEYDQAYDQAQQLKAAREIQGNIDRVAKLKQLDPEAAALASEFSSPVQESRVPKIRKLLGR